MTYDGTVQSVWAMHASVRPRDRIRGVWAAPTWVFMDLSRAILGYERMPVFLLGRPVRVDESLDDLMFEIPPPIDEDEWVFC